MPVLCFRSNISLPEPQRKELLREATRVVSRLLRSEGCRVMASWVHCDMLLDGSDDPAVYAEVQSIFPIDDRACRDLCAAVFDIVNRYATMESSRVYLYLPVVNSRAAWKFVNGQPVSPGSPLTPERADHHDN